MPNLSEAKERRLNQFGKAVLIWCGKNVRFDRVCRIIRQRSDRRFIRQLTALISYAEPNACITIMYKSSHKSLRELILDARKFYEEETMVAKDLEERKLC